MSVLERVASNGSVWTFVIAREVYSVDFSTHCASLTENDDCSGFMEVDE
ncbi:putative predicted protein [Rhizobium favelukesii]|uniref:Uncharacterized protein n=1 Tax=Rhizobium favelukesii TaxID=348824 RepID=W6RFQ8_9HYPH|nr:putative predicted protein [Rhizobium favelukesii]